jgi:hypothetical protein
MIRLADARAPRAPRPPAPHPGSATGVPVPAAAHRYARHAAAADRCAWSVERDIRWDRIDVARARTRPDLLARIRDAALIESFHPVNLAALVRRCWDDVDAGAVFSLEMYEGFRHFHALRTYLDAVAWEPALTDADIAAAREAAVAAPVPAPGEDPVPALVEFMLSEHLAIYFFRRLAEQSPEPVLADLLRRISADEVRHARSAADLIARRIAGDPACIPLVLEAAAGFHHFGERVVGDVPIAMPGDPIAIRSFARRIGRLCGVRYVDFLKGRL